MTIPVRLRLFALGLALLVGSCQAPSPAAVFPHEAVLTDPTVVQALRHYFAVHRLNRRNTVLCLTLKQRPYRGGLFYVAHRYGVLAEDRLPSQFCAVDSAVVLVYGGAEPYLTQPGLADELARYLAAYRVHLTEHLVLSHAPEWQVQTCDGKVITTELEPGEYDTAPCGYVLRENATGQVEVVLPTNAPLK
jgi:hypothetical protein